MKKKAVCGIYEIRNIKNGKSYYGSSNDIFGRRWPTHKNNLKKGTHDNSYLQRSYNKWGEDAFEIFVLEECSREELKDKEQVYLDKHFGRRECYNLSENADRPPANIGRDNPMWGKPLSEEAKKKLSEVRKGKYTGENHSQARAIVITFQDNTSQAFPCVTGPVGVVQGLGIGRQIIRGALKRGYFMNDPKLKEALRGARIAYLN